MRSPDEIMNFVYSNNTHFLDVHKPGFLKKPPYASTTYCGHMAFGRGANACARELYMNENAIYAFTAWYKPYLSDGYVRAMICFTDRCRIIAACEDSAKTNSHNVDKSDLDKMRLNTFADGSGEISIGDFVRAEMRFKYTTEAEKVAQKLIAIVKRYYKSDF